MEDNKIITTNKNLNKLLLNQIQLVQNDLLLVSAFCKVEILKYVDLNLCNDSVSKRLIVRFRLSDILAGATDLQIIDYCKKNNWDLRILPNLHAKTYIFDNKKVIVGSANLTQNGVGISAVPNVEMSVLFKLSEAEVFKLQDEFSNAVEISESLLDKMIAEMNAANKSRSSAEWSVEIQDDLQCGVDVLFVEDFENLEAGNLYTSRPYQWLTKILKNSKNQEQYFGSLSEKLHNTLLNEPEPYRKDVKNILSDLLELCQNDKKNKIEVTRPRHSQLVRLVGNKK